MSPKPRVPAGVWTALRAAAVLLVLALLGRSVQQGLDGASFARLTLRPAPLLGAAGVGALALLTLAWASVVGARASQGLPAGLTFALQWGRVWFQSYFFRYVPGKVALVGERVRLGRRFGLSASASAALVLWESMLLLAAATVVGMLSFAGPGVGPALIPPAQAAALGLFALLCSAALFPALHLAARVVPRLAALLPPTGGQPRVLLQLGLTGLNALAWALLGLSFAWTAAALSPVGPDQHLMLIGVFVASYAGGQLAQVAPAGLGVREAFLVAALASLSDPGTTLAWAVVHRVVLAVVELALLGLAQRIPLPPAPEEPDAA